MPWESRDASIFSEQAVADANAKVEAMLAAFAQIEKSGPPLKPVTAMLGQAANFDIVDIVPSSVVDGETFDAMFAEPADFKGFN
jgi:hypothetical protein